jgi:hypothetical protein
MYADPSPLAGRLLIARGEGGTDAVIQKTLSSLTLLRRKPQRRYSAVRAYPGTALPPSAEPNPSGQQQDERGAQTIMLNTPTTPTPKLLSRTPSRPTVRCYV